MSRLPERAALGAGALLGALVRSPLGIREEVVRSNLRRAFPAADEQWIDRVAGETFRHLGRETIATLRLSTLPAAAVVERTRMRGWEAFTRALQQGRGAILVTGHFGNWEVAAASVTARGIPMEAVMKRLRNPLLDARLEQTRRRLGIGTIEMRQAPRRVPRALAAGRVVGMVADQDARRAGVWIPFFGHPASTHRGPALFALRFQAPLFACAVRRLAGGHYEASLEPVAVERTDNLEADVRALTAAWTERLESAVRADPEQYFWLHKRWKTASPAELAAGVTGSNSTAEDARDGVPADRTT